MYDNPILIRSKNETDFDYKVRLCVAKLNKEIDLDWIELRDYLGLDCSPDHLRKISYGYKEMVDNNNNNNNSDENVNENNLPNYKEEIEILKDGSHRSDKLLAMSSEDSKNPNYLLEAHGYDPKEWEIINAKSSIWNQHNKVDGTLTLYSSKITVKPKTNGFGLDDVKEIVRDLMKNYQPPTINPLKHHSNGKLLEVNVSDLHLNKLGYIDGEYDHSIAEKSFFYIIDNVIKQTKHIKFEKILFIWSHDFFNIDNMSKSTTRGTPQDVSTSFSNMYKQGKRMLISAIDILKQIAPVETVQVGANHDRLTAYTMSEVLSAWYRNDDNVAIDNDPLSRKYRRFGKCLIGFSHGNSEKKRLGKIMPVEARKQWGETLFAEIHAGHFHSEQAVKEENGVIVRYLSSPSGTDTWHFESGYVGAIKKAQSFVWDKDRGLELIINTPVLEEDLTK